MQLRWALALSCACLACGSRTSVGDWADAPPSSAGAPSMPAPEGSAGSSAAPQGCLATGPLGTLSWSRQLHNSGRAALAADRLGNTIVESEKPRASIDLTKLDSHGAPLWTVHFQPDVQVSGGQGRFSTDSQNNTLLLSPFAADGYKQPTLSKVGPDGSIAFTERLTQREGGYWGPSSLQTDAAGEVIVQGVAETPVDLGGGTLDTAERDFFIARYDAQGGHLWSRSFGGPVSYLDLAAHADGGSVVAGTVSGSVRFGEQTLSSDVGAPFVAGLTRDGAVVYAHLLDTPHEANLRDVVVDAKGNGYVALTFADALDVGETVLESQNRSTAVILKYDARGKLLWHKLLGYVYSLALAVTPQGDLALGGSSPSPIALGSSMLGSDGWFTFAAKLNAAGKLLGSFTCPGTTEFPAAVAVDACGGVLLGGTFRGRFDTGQEVLTAREVVDGELSDVLDSVVLRVSL